MLWPKSLPRTARPNRPELVALKPELVVIAGPNGSGKTTITRRVIQHAWGKGCLYLNPDEIAQFEFGGWDSPEATLQAA